MAKARRPASGSKQGKAPQRQQRQQRKPSGTAWRQQADWYDQRHGERGDDLHSKVVLPAVLRHLQVAPGQRVFDCCCGQGVLSRRLVEQGASCVALDASPELIERARSHGEEAISYHVGDAKACGDILAGEQCDAAAVVLALQDLDPIDGVFTGMAQLLNPGGCVVLVLTHPCFRQIHHSRWQWNDAQNRQERVLDAYMTEQSATITTHPGKRGHGKGPSSQSFHRPLSAYINALGRAGFAVVASEELCSPRRGSAGPKAAAEDQAAREFPVFCLLKARLL